MPYNNFKFCNSTLFEPMTQENTPNPKNSESAKSQTKLIQATDMQEDSLPPVELSGSALFEFDIDAFLKQLTQRPGIYRMLNKKGVII